MKYIVSFVFSLSCVAMLAQLEQPYEDYNWEMEPELHDLDSTLMQEDEVMIKNLIYREMVVSDLGQVEQFNTRHTIIKVNTDAAVEENNKMYLSSNAFSEVLEQKARVIKPNGEVIELDESDIEEAENEDGVNTRYFALEGVEIGAEVEYLYKTKSSLRLSGSYVYVQNELPQLDFEFRLVYPQGYEMETKFYNLEKDSLNLDTLTDVYHELNYTLKDVKGFKTEPSAFKNPHIGKFAYKLKNNHYSQIFDVYSYGTNSRGYFDFFMTMPEKKELKSCKKFLKAAGVYDISDTEEKIRALEKYVRKTVQLFPFNFSIGYDDTPVTGALKTNFANGDTFTKIFTNCLSVLGVEYELVLTSDRSRGAFDEDFESYLSMQEYMIYIPELDKYLTPTESNYYLGLMPGNWADNHGLFIRKATLAGTETGIGKVKYIDALPPEVTRDNMEVDCTINAEDLLVKLDFTRESHGYYARVYQPIFSLLDEDGKEEISEAMATWMSEDLEVENVEVKNTAEDDFGKKPIIVSAESETDLFISQAGNKILFKLGELIGPQMEMYGEEGEERKLPVDEEYTRYYTRDIKINIPDGYEVQNPEDMNIDVRHLREDEELSVFVSSYTIEGNTITLHCEEFYRDITLPVEEFEDYQRVINAAADFNKIVLVLKEG